MDYAFRRDADFASSCVVSLNESTGLALSLATRASVQGRDVQCILRGRGLTALKTFSASVVSSHLDVRFVVDVLLLCFCAVQSTLRQWRNL